MMNAESAEFQAFVPNNEENPAKKRKKTEKCSNRGKDVASDA
jgi:hypothetical protein